METNNSVTSFFEVLMTRLHEDIAEGYHVCERTLNAERIYLRQRIRKEGLSFLTKTLPAMGKAVDKALSTDAPLDIVGFTTHGVSKLPSFLGWLLERIFNTHSGMPLHGKSYIATRCPSNDEFIHQDTGPTYRTVVDETGVPRAPFSVIETVTALRHFRQFVQLLYKLRIEHEETTAEKVVNQFVQTDIALADIPMYNLQCANVLSIARRLASGVFGTFDEMAITPTHGPGAVATGEKDSEKSVFKRIYRSVEQKYPFTEYFCFNLNHVVDGYPDMQLLEELEAGTAKVVLVPKDSRGPRLISCEPLEIQWIQQGLGRAVQAHLEQHRLTRGFVNFTDQSINARLALQSSRDGQWVTLDMKDASDRVSLRLVKEVFELCPRLLDALIATRSTHTRLPSGIVMALNKFAPMGSCLCFPIESFVFWALAIGAIVDKYRLTRREALKLVYVYGDDLIVHSSVYRAVLQYLPEFGLKFNDGKCCTEGFFRESCGCDAYIGADITPTRLRAVWSRNFIKDPSVLYGYTAFSNAMYLKGYMRVVNYVRSHIVNVYGLIPYTSLKDDCAFADKPEAEREGAGVVFYQNHASSRQLNLLVERRINYDIQRVEYLTWAAKARKRKATCGGYPELLRRTNGALGEQKGSYAVRRSSRLQRRWTVVDHG